MSKNEKIELIIKNYGIYKQRRWSHKPVKYGSEGRHLLKLKKFYLFIYKNLIWNNLIYHFEHLNISWSSRATRAVSGINEDEFILLLFYF